MFWHVSVGVTDPERAAEFYDAVFAPLGIVRFGTDLTEGWIGWQKAGARFPTFWVCRPFDGGPPAPGNGAMNGFLAPTRVALHEAYAAGLAHGGRCDGPPGLRRYAPDWYGAYLRDPDGNKLCIVHRAGE